MKINQQMPDEPVIENHPASAWGWFLSAVAYVIVMFGAVMFFMVKTTNSPAWDAWVAKTQAQIGQSNYALMCIGGMLLLFVPFMVALDRAGRISYQYRKQRGQTTHEDDKVESNAGFFKFMMGAAALTLIVLIVIKGTAR
jgi:hypothetical protein